MRTSFTPFALVLVAAACSANEMPVAPDATGNRPELGPPPAGTNNNPVVTIAVPVPGTVGVPVNVTAAFTDADGADTHTCSLDWQIAAAPGSVTESAGTGTCAGSFVYQAAGQYKVIAAVIDNAGGTGMDSVMVDVAVAPPAPPPPPPPPPPVTPPTGTGLLFGEGRLAPPAGSQRRYEAPAFEVGARYGREGKGLRAQFEFAASGIRLRFRANSADLFTVTGGVAELRGKGRVADHVEAMYLVRALDGKQAGAGRTDRIRIKIWNAGGVLYDSAPGSPENADPATPVERGGIVIRP